LCSVLLSAAQVNYCIIAVYVAVTFTLPSRKETAHAASMPTAPRFAGWNQRPVPLRNVAFCRRVVAAAAVEDLSRRQHRRLDTPAAAFMLFALTGVRDVVVAAAVPRRETAVPWRELSAVLQSVPLNVASVHFAVGAVDWAANRSCIAILADALQSQPCHHELSGITVAEGEGWSEAQSSGTADDGAALLEASSGLPCLRVLSVAGDAGAAIVGGGPPRRWRRVFIGTCHDEARDRAAQHAGAQLARMRCITVDAASLMCSVVIAASALPNVRRLVLGDPLVVSRAIDIAESATLRSLHVTCVVEEFDAHACLRQLSRHTALRHVDFPQLASSFTEAAAAGDVAFCGELARQQWSGTLRVRESGDLPMTAAVRHMQLDIVELLAAEWGASAVAAAALLPVCAQADASESVQRCIALLLALGCAVNQRDGHSRCALHVAAAGVDRPSIAGALLLAGADPSVADGWGDTPLHIAARCGNLGVLTLLLDHLEAVDVMNGRRRTALDVSRMFHQDDAAALLVARGCVASPFISPGNNH
jgi:hypothetical protein